jgi:3-phosphoshikimate 1-carboxyvinyltransferase
VAAAFAQGDTRMNGLKEVRVKESDRLEATADMLRVNGVKVDVEGDDMIVHGMGPSGLGATGVPGGGEVKTHMDHRIAMSALMMGLASISPVRIDDSAFIATSFPGFVETMRGLGADLS